MSACPCTKNVLRMFEPHFWKKIRMLSLDEKNHHSYKKACGLIICYHAYFPSCLSSVVAFFVIRIFIALKPLTNGSPLLQDFFVKDIGKFPLLQDFFVKNIGKLYVYDFCLSYDNFIG